MMENIIFCGFLASLCLLGVTQADMGTVMPSEMGQAILRAPLPWYMETCVLPAQQKQKAIYYLNHFSFEHTGQYYDFESSSLQGHKKDPQCLILQDAH